MLYTNLFFPHEKLKTKETVAVKPAVLKIATAQATS
jgi:hypothetical protein